MTMRSPLKTSPVGVAPERNFAPPTPGRSHRPASPDGKSVVADSATTFPAARDVRGKGR